MVRKLTSDFYADIKTPEDLLPPGAEVGSVPTDYNQSTGLERYEILGKMRGVDVFDMRPLDSSRTGTCHYSCRPRGRSSGWP